MRSKLVVSILILAFAAPCIGAATFTDVPLDHWAYPYVDKLVTQYQVISGFPDNTYRGDKTLNRYEFSKALVASLKYIEATQQVGLKADTARQIEFTDVTTTHWAYPYLMDLVSRYQIISGYPDGTFRGTKTLSRNEVAVAVAKALGRVEEAAKSPLKLKVVTLTDLPSTHWAYSSVQKLVSADIVYPYEDGTFKGDQQVSRYLLAYILSNFIDRSVEMFKTEVIPPSELIDRSLEVAPWPVAYVSGGTGNIYEGASATNNWLNLHASASYGDIFDLWRFSGNYEITGRYGYSQVNYMVPSGGGGVSSSLVGENRLELEANTIHPLVEFFGISGKLLLGLKYFNLNNPVAPTDFAGVNAGLATSARVFGRNLLARGFYSYPVSRGNVSTSVLGQPDHLLDYEVSTDANLLSYPVLLGLTGEIMYLSGGYSRYYNAIFVRHFLL